MRVLCTYERSLAVAEKREEEKGTEDEKVGVVGERREGVGFEGTRRFLSFFLSPTNRHSQHPNLLFSPLPLTPPLTTDPLMPSQQPEAGPSNASFDSQGSMPMDISSDSLLPPPPLPLPSAAQPQPSTSASLPPPPIEPSTNDLPPRPIPEPQPDYGRRYDMLLQALEVAVRKGVNKFTFVPPSLPLLPS